jgi:hypothetical protein
MGYAEIGQTHVIKARNEKRLAPKIIAEREAELLFFPTASKAANRLSVSKKTRVKLTYGLENLGYLTVDLASPSFTWPVGYPDQKDHLIDGTDSEYYLPASVTDVNLNFDLLANRAINGVYLKLWYYSGIESIRIGCLSDDRVDHTGAIEKQQWIWIDGGSVPDDLNVEVVIPFTTQIARYVQIRIQGGWQGEDRSSDWGLRVVKISGKADGILVDDDENSDVIASFIPTETADVLVEAYMASGSFLGSIHARPPSQQRGIMDQMLTDKHLEPYSTTKAMWSSTLPWNWVKEGTILVISVEDSFGRYITYDFRLEDTVLWSEHTLIRQKFVLFGNESQFNKLNTYTFDATRLAKGMFGIMPVATLNWVDASLLHWPYLVISTSKGPRIVKNEKERRSEMRKAGDDPSSEPGWEFTKYMVAFRTSFANTGRGFALTELEAPDQHGSPYSTQTSIAMGWALVDDGIDCSYCEYKSLGYWEAWAAAASTGWCGMKAGDECGDTLSH